MENFYKKWVKSPRYFTLEVNNKAIGEIEVLKKHKFPNHQLNFTIQGINYCIKNTGSWESTFNVFDNKNNLILTSKHKNWRLKGFVVQYNNTLYEIIYESSIGPTWHLLKKRTKLISYSLNIKQDIVVKDHLYDPKTEILFDFILLYLIAFN